MLCPVSNQRRQPHADLSMSMLRIYCFGALTVDPEGGIFGGKAPDLLADSACTGLAM